MAENETLQIPKYNPPVPGGFLRNIEPEKLIASNIGEIKIRESNALGGIKFDKGKVRPTLMWRSLNKAVASVQEILEFGARKYAPDNWALVEPERYDDAALRHIQAYLSGEVNDPESGKHHLAHAICCLMFRLELDLRKSNST